MLGAPCRCCAGSPLYPQDDKSLVYSSRVTLLAPMQLYCLVPTLLTTALHVCLLQVVHDNVATRSMLFGEHPAQEGECARRRACYIDGIDSLLAEEDLITASSHMQRALQVRGCCRSFVAHL